MDPCPRGRFTVPRASIPTLSFRHSSFKTLPPLEIFFLLHPRPGESHISIEHAAVSSGSCVYIGAGLARNSCLFRDIMVIRKWKRIFLSSTRRTLEDFGSEGSLSKEEISSRSPPRSLSRLLELGVPSNV